MSELVGLFVSQQLDIQGSKYIDDTAICDIDLRKELFRLQETVRQYCFLVHDLSNMLWFWLTFNP